MNEMCQEGLNYELLNIVPENPKMRVRKWILNYEVRQETVLKFLQPYWQRHNSPTWLTNISASVLASSLALNLMCLGWGWHVYSGCPPPYVSYVSCPWYLNISDLHSSLKLFRCPSQLSCPSCYSSRPALRDCLLLEFFSVCPSSVFSVVKG